MLTPNNLVKHELIGLRVKVNTSTNKNQEGLEGIVVDETRNTLVIETESGEKILIKDQCSFIFEVGSENVKVDGKILVARPEDRIKKKQKKW